MVDSAVEADSRDDASTRAEPMVAVYRHDVHKLRARPHASAADSYASVPVNETVPRDADRDAALLSRPAGEPEQTVANHESPYRLSLLTGETAATTERIKATTGGGFRALVTPEDPECLHARWLTSEVPAAFNESVYYPYTSLQYHVLLTAALLHNYRARHAFEDLFLVATTPDVTPNADAVSTRDPKTALAADAVEPHRTVLWTPEMTLHVTATPGDRPAARLGDVPARSFADVWSRLPAHPFDTDGERRWRLLDAQLRRIRSWSAALAYIDEFIELHGSAAGELEGDGA
ncbi:hypothetical protein HALDL1_03615 [Halobacterium sp. DL1]|jgi:hypothetical protein|uniref:DUF8168 domain-containing protein n=1 Tax=Halorubrum lacusprofundi (strain ATCC 49239 / DSM 5036 / JCM 8891 / ACAM 34) TaxID=416348 RepID=B9LVZ1_HALLT|nr:hypothetical protein [Halorubrum lacusprofundi]ACM58381.1 conserved hypothetical protein [Halorubrum lacusprofundi ATCC 49239]AHG02815.1 hypothetical protein HALDL1_03615 [Halobacterium sp. DL1]